MGIDSYQARQVKLMARASEWAGKVLVLLKSGNLAGAVAQIKVAPSVKDIKALQAMLAAAPFKGRWPDVDTVVADNIDALSAPRLHRSP
jgi:hypothetical protein